MRSRALRLAEGSVDRALGSVLAADARGADGRIALRKGTLLGEAHRGALARLVNRELHLVELEDGELQQDEAARRLASAVAGPGTLAEDPRQGQARIRATARGVLHVRTGATRAINALPPLLCFTQPDGQVVLEGDEVAGTKAAALATPGALVAEADALARSAGGVVSVAPFVPRRVSVIITERIDRAGRSAVAAAIRRKVAWYGSEVLELAEAPHEREAVSSRLAGALARGVDLFLISGANPLDPLDPVLDAVRGVGGEVLRWGVPAHPGSMVWVAAIGEATVLGVAMCSGFGKNTSLDVLLARVLAGEQPARAADELGHGGLLEGPTAAWRFPPYDRSQPAELSLSSPM